MIFFIRKITKNFILIHRNRSINELPIEYAPIVENDEEDLSLEGYVNNVVMPLFIDAKGLLLSIVPIILRVNIYIVNIDTSAKARNKPNANPINILENKA
jgi:hypothetical protein